MVVEVHANIPAPASTTLGNHLVAPLMAAAAVAAAAPAVVDLGHSPPLCYRPLRSSSNSNSNSNSNSTSTSTSTSTITIIFPSVVPL